MLSRLMVPSSPHPSDAVTGQDFLSGGCKRLFLGSPGEVFSAPCGLLVTGPRHYREQQTATLPCPAKFNQSSKFNVSVDFRNIFCACHKCCLCGKMSQHSGNMIT